MQSSTKTPAWVWLLLAAFIVVWFYMLGARTLVPTDEGRYAEMAREMSVSNDWITPRLNGIKYFEKPPLQVWMNALTFELFGLGDWQARLWTGLCGLLGIALVAYTGRRVFSPATGVGAGLVLASSFWWAAFGHVNSLDMGLASMMTVALCGLLLAQVSPTVAGRRNWMLTCWAGVALSVLSKGLVGLVLPGAVLVLYSLLTRDWGLWKRLHLVAGSTLFLLITVPWFVLVSIQNPEFPYFFFVHEHLQRFTSNVHHRTGPWYYFIPILLVGIVPWLGVLAQALIASWRDASNPTGLQPKKLLLVWSVFIFLFFSISGSKLPSYVLPIFPALALLIGDFLQHARRRTWACAAILVLMLGMAGLALVPVLPNLASDPIESGYLRAGEWWLGSASLAMVGGAALVLWWARRQLPRLGQVATLALALSGFTAGQLLMLGYDPYGSYRAGLPLVAAIQAELQPDVNFYAVGLYDQTMPFYLQRTMTLVEHADELAFGLEQEPQRWIPKLETFIARWRAEPRQGIKSIAMMRPAMYDELTRAGLPMRVIARDPRRVIVTNQLR